MFASWSRARGDLWTVKGGEGSPAANRILTSVLNNEAQAPADTANSPQASLWWRGSV